MSMTDREISRLNRRIEREKAARQEAETLLEEKSRALYEANLALGLSLSDLEQQVRQRTADLTQAKDEAERANRFKSDFLANMSHEIRTPMNAVIGLSHLMAQTELSDKQQDYLDKIRSSSRTLLGVINDILDFSKIEAGKLSIETVPFQMTHMIHDVMVVVQSQAEGKGLDVTIEMEPHVPDTVIGDPLRLSQVLLNLLGNAVKFTKQGQVRLTVGGRQGDNDLFHLDMTVRDSGIGMTAEQVSRLFQPFHQADSSTTRRFGGTGLGLAICHQLMGLMGGAIAVESISGVGSSFSLSVPLKQTRRVVVIPEDAPAFSFSQCRLLLVEDNPINQLVACELLAQFDLMVTVASDGAAALEILAKQSFDAILMDVQMPGMDGLTATRHIRQGLGLGEIPIIAMTAHAMDEDRQRCLEAGMNDHIAKPIDPDLLSQILQRWLRTVTPVDAKYSATEETGSVLPQALPGIDLAVGLRNLNKNSTLLRKLLRDFAAACAPQVTKIQEFIVEGQWAQLRLLAHSIKGTSSTLGAGDVAAFAATLERLSRAEAPDPEALCDVADQMAAAMTVVVEGLSQLPPEAEAAGARSSASPADIAAEITALQRLLERYDPAGVEAAETLKSHLQGSSLLALANDVVNHASAFDFDEAAVFLGRLSDHLSNHGIEA
jgi:signal transduction histidine kinase/CheY-like chemotaxis protein/HPt (histidine-containing phosphotransfer) domain-containing protein